MSESRTNSQFSRRDFLKIMGAAAGTAALGPVLGTSCGPAARPTGPVKIGVLLPYSDIYAVLGESITEAMKMYFEEVGNKAGGREIQLIQEDTEIKPDVGLQKARKLVEQDNVDFVTGIVSSGVLLAVRDYFDTNKKLLICSNAGANEISRGKKTRYIWRTSFSNWQPNWPLGTWAYNNVAKKVYCSAPDYAAGHDMVRSFLNSFQAAGGEVLDTVYTPYPTPGDYAPFITAIKNANPPMVFSFYSGGAAVGFVKAWGEQGLTGQTPFVCAGFTVSEDVLPAQGDAALGAYSGLFYSAVQDNAENKKFAPAYKARTARTANNFSVQGYDTARVIVEALNAVQGDTSNLDKFIDAIAGVSFASPRGAFRFDTNTHNVIHHIYARQVQKVDGELVNAILEDLGEIADPGDDSKG